MKNIVLKASVIALLSVVGCQEKLDTVGGDIPSVAYMTNSNALVNIAKDTEGGETVIEPRLASVAKKDVTIEVSVEDFLEAYNAKNKTQYRLLPNQAFELYEVANPNNKSSNGKIRVVVKAGDFSARVGVRVQPLDKDTYPIGVRYAIPLTISSATEGILSNKSAVVTFNRPVKTEVMQIKRGWSFSVVFDEQTPDMPEFTVQGQFMFLNWASQNQTTIYGGGYYTRVSRDGYQVKDGGGDGPETWASYPMQLNKWYQITHVYKGNIFYLYINGELVKTFERSQLAYGPTAKAMSLAIGNNNSSYSADQRVREIRLWNRALTKDEINDGLYIPADPNSEGLIVYLPIDEKNGHKNITKYNHITKYYSQGREMDENSFKNNITWTRNVKFPAETLVIEE